MNENEKEAENGKRHFFKFLIFKWQYYQLKLNRFGKRSEVEAEAGGATNDDVISFTSEFRQIKFIRLEAFLYLLG